VTAGSSQSFTISAQPNCQIQNVFVDGNAVGALGSYTFNNVTANHTISATFIANSYTITASAGANGSISPSGAVSQSAGSSRTFTISPNSGYHVANVSVDGVSVGAVSSYTFNNIVAAHTIAASFSVDTYTITATAGANGSITPSGSIVLNSGANRTFTVTPNNGYKIDDVRVDNASIGAASSYSFTAVNANHTIAALFAAVNQAPRADAGPDQAVDEATIVKLSGLNSGDPDDGIASIQWAQLSGPTVVLSAPNSAEATFTAPDVGTQGVALVFELAVTDRSGQKATDTCIVNVIWVNIPPTAQAGADQVVEEGTLITLSGANSSDPDDGIAAFAWKQVQGPSVALNNANSSVATFTAPQTTPQGCSLVFELTVKDKGGLQATDSCVVTVTWTNSPPTADAGPDQSVSEGTIVTLSGANSMDSDDGISSYRWTQISGTPVTLSDATAVKPFILAPDVGPAGASLGFRLTVTDQGGLQNQDECMINVTWQNMPPVAHAGADQSVDEGALVNLDGSTSSDSDDGIAGYQWSQIGGTPVTLSDPRSKQPTFTAPDVGSQGTALTFKLTVTDYNGLKSEDTCLVNVVWRNQPPIAVAGPDLTSYSQTVVMLNGSNSSDPDDGIASYRWRQLSGVPITLSDASAAATTFTAPTVNTETPLVLELSVMDRGGLLSADQCTVLVRPAQSTDTTAPSIQITYPSTSNSFTTKSKITLKGTTADDRGVVRVEWRNQYGDGGVAAGTAAWQIVELRLRRFNNEITITAFDAAGNSSSKKVNIFAGYWR
jgi:hypothetical protein